MLGGPLGLLALLQVAALQLYPSDGPQCTRPGEDVRLVQYSVKDGDRCEEPDDGFSRPSYYGTEGFNYCWHVRNLNEREPQLKPNTGMLTIADTCSSNTDESRRSLVIGAPAPLDPNDPSSILQIELRQDCSFFSTLVRERGGIRVGNESYDLQCVIIGDSSNPLQVTNSTSRLVLDFRPDFLITPRGSLMTEHASKQAVLDGKALLSPAGSSPRIYSEAAALAGEVGAGARTLAFGLQPPTETYARRGLEAVFDAARRFDASCFLSDRPGEATNFSARLGAAPRTAAAERDPCELASRCEAGSCVKSLKLGVVLENSSYSSSSFPVRDMCGNATALWTSLGGVANVSTAVIAGRRDSRLEYVQASRDVDDAAYESSLASALAQLRDDGATVVLVCSPGAVEVPDIMRNLSYAPLATILTTSLYKSRYRTRMAEGWWEGEYFLETYPWDRALPGPKGAFTNLTSREYYNRFLLEFGTAPGRHSAITIATLSVLAHAIESTGSLNTSAVTEALLSSELKEFFGNISFDAHGQQDAALAAFPVIQYLPSSTRKGVLDGSELPLADVVDYSAWGETIREVAFPMPTWELRECRRADPCGANGWCKQDGPGRAACECEEGFEFVDGGCSEILPPSPPSPPPPPEPFILVTSPSTFLYYAIGPPCGAVALILLALWAALRRKRYYQKKADLLAEANQALQDAALEMSGAQCTFVFIKADVIRSGLYEAAGYSTLPRLQEILAKHPGWARKQLLRRHLAYGCHEYRDSILAVSHRWEQPDAPDASGVHVRAIREHLQRCPGIDLVWYDYWCMPQGPDKTAVEKIDFKRMLMNVNLLYLGSSVLILQELSYMSRFWTQFEAWCSMQEACDDGLRPAPAERRRCLVVPIHQATEALAVELVRMWADRTVDEAIETLASPDVTITNQSDKELQLYKLRELDSLVREAVEQCRDGAGAERASTRAVSRGAASRVSGSGSSRSSRCIVEMSQ